LTSALAYCKHTSALLPFCKDTDGMKLFVSCFFDLLFSSFFDGIVLSVLSVLSRKKSEANGEHLPSASTGKLQKH
jgi:hypothetical protein